MRSGGVVGAMRRMRFRPVCGGKLGIARVFIGRQIEDEQAIDARRFGVAMKLPNP